MNERVGREGALDARSLARACFDAAVAGAHPHASTCTAVDRTLAADRPEHVVLLAIGKAAPAMLRAALASLGARGVHAAAALCVAPEVAELPSPAMAVRGDHPVPGASSLAAADRVGEFVARMPRGALALVLLSGGASSLVAAPVPGATMDDVSRLTTLLLGAGTDIAVTNAVRKRFLRWGAGRLATALVSSGAGAVRCLAISDVPGDDPAVIGSGPCVPDALRAPDLLALLDRHGLRRRLPGALREMLERATAEDETPKPGAAAFARTTTRVIAGNATALEAAAERARSLGARAAIGAPLAGEARACGDRLARELLAAAHASAPLVRVWGGETVVSLGDHAGLGGRSQELALAAARRLHDGASARELVLLAAGTDGRDGPTDAAGAIVDARTWDAIGRAGRDPLRDLDTHDAWHALDTVGALLRTGPTGTNVADVAVGVVV